MSTHLVDTFKECGRSLRWNMMMVFGRQSCIPYALPADRTWAEGGRKGGAPAQGEEGSLICRVTSGSPAICLVRAETGSPSAWSFREESRVGADCTVPCFPSRAGLL